MKSTVTNMKKGKTLRNNMSRIKVNVKEGNGVNLRSERK